MADYIDNIEVESIDATHRRLIHPSGLAVAEVLVETGEGPTWQTDSEA